MRFSCVQGHEEFNFPWQALNFTHQGKRGQFSLILFFFLSFLHVLFKSHLAESACIAAFTSPLSSLFFLKEVLLALYETINHNTACTERKLGFFFHRGFPSTGCWHHYYTGSHCVCSYSPQRHKISLIAQISFTFLLANKAIYNFQCISDASMMRLLRDFQGYVTHNEASEIKKKGGGGIAAPVILFTRSLIWEMITYTAVKYVKNRPLLNGSVMHLHFYDSFFYVKCYNIVIDLFQNQCLFLYCLFNATYLTWFIIYLLNL